MISCTEYIPLYSEFFKFLEKHGGHKAVEDYWQYCSDTGTGDKTNPNSLAARCESFGGYEGAVSYWGHSLTEEACDYIEIQDAKNKFFIGHMRHCPSRGKLNDLEHIEPYYDYCGHCKWLYSRVLKNYDTVYEMDHTEIDNAACRWILYENGHCPDIDWKNITDDEMREYGKKEGIKLIDLSREGAKYLHRDFHVSCDRALKYCGDNFGYDALVAFLTGYVKLYYAPKIEKIRKEGLSGLKAWIESVYEKEEASDYIRAMISDDKLVVEIKKSPAIEHMHSLGKEPSKYYIEGTRTLYKTIADETGLTFEMPYYESDGATKLIFTVK